MPVLQAESKAERVPIAGITGLDGDGLANCGFGLDTVTADEPQHGKPGPSRKFVGRAGDELPAGELGRGHLAGADQLLDSSNCSGAGVVRHRFENGWCPIAGSHYASLYRGTIQGDTGGMRILTIE